MIDISESLPVKAEMSYKPTRIQASFRHSNEVEVAVSASVLMRNGAAAGLAARELRSHALRWRSLTASALAGGNWIWTST